MFVIGAFKREWRFSRRYIQLERTINEKERQRRKGGDEINSLLRVIPSYTSCRYHLKFIYGVCCGATRCKGWKDRR